MKLKFAAISASALFLTTCSIPAAGVQIIEKPYSQPFVMSDTTIPSFFDMAIKEKQDEKIRLERRIEALKLDHNRYLINKRIQDLEAYVGKTWYVFSGSTPKGWDCSGLTMWFYENLGVSLEHSATKQYRAGQLVTNPNPGDLVVFKYNDSNMAYHVGIYISENVMLHSGGKKGDKTEYQDIAAFAGNYSEVYYVRFIESN